MLHLLPSDGATLYTETNLDNFFPEPWNMVTSALFLIPALYWLIKLKGFDRNHVFLSIAVWLLLIGCVGSTVYHGLRQWRFFMYMDWVPIALLCVLSSVYFVVKLSGRLYYGTLTLAAFGAVELVLYQLYLQYDKHIMFSINYGVMVLMIVMPLVLLLRKNRWHNGWLVAGAFFAFGLALFYRIVDANSTWPMGTHFLWHIFGAVATALMFLFIYELKIPVPIKAHEARIFPMYKEGDKLEGTGS